MSEPASSKDMKRLEEAQQAAMAVQAMTDQNAKFGPAGAAKPGAGAGAGGGRAEDETTIGMLRKKYGIGGGNVLSGFLGGA